MNQRKTNSNIFQKIALLLGIFLGLYVIMQSVFFFGKENIVLSEEKKEFLNTVLMSYQSLNYEASVEDYTLNEAIIKVTDNSGKIRRHLFDLNKKIITTANFTGSIRGAGIIFAFASEYNSDSENTNSYEFNDDLQLEQIRRSAMNYNFVYDENGNLIQNKIDNCIIVEKSYNEQSLLTRVKYANGTTVNYNYDELSNLISQYINDICVATYSYEDLNLTSYKDHINDVKYNYEYKDDVISKIICSNGFCIEYHYDSENNLAGKDYYLLDNNIKYEIFDNGFKTNKFIKVNNFDDKERLIDTTINYDSNGDILKSTYLYDNSFELPEQETFIDEKTELPLENSDTNTYNTIVKQIQNEFLDVSYTSDILGNVTDYSYGVNNFKMTYDDKNQLISYSINDNITEIEYDLHGNILNKGDIKYVYGNELWADQLTAYNGLPILYDKSGNPINYMGNELIWNGRLLCSYNNIHYTYNNSGIRTSKENAMGRTEYFLDGKNVIFEKSKLGVITYYYEGNNVVGLNINGGDYFYIKNAQDDIIGIVNQNGKLVVEYIYTPWGEIESITGELADSVGVINPYRYHSYRYDEDTKLYYLNSRYYDPMIGRFINTDDMDYLANTLLGDDLTKNLYTYCRNNPFNLEDNNGTMSRAFINMTKTLYADWGIIADSSIGSITMALNGFGVYNGFHETAQLVAAKALKRNGAKNIELEKKCSTGEIDIYAEFGASREVWEVKPTGQQSSARSQLSRYVNATGYNYGRAVGGVGKEYEINFMHKVYMIVSFSSGIYQGAITYRFEKRWKDWLGREHRESVSNAQLKKGFDAALWVALIVSGTIIVATIAEDVLTAGAGIWNDGPSLLAAAKSFMGTLKIGFWVIGLA